jgi:hypothetical protein
VGFVGDEGELGQIFFEYIGFPANHSTDCSSLIIIIIIIIIIYHPVRYNSLNSGKCVKWTQFYPASKETFKVGLEALWCNMCTELSLIILSGKAQRFVCFR